MGILQRFGDIMRANINDLLSGAENKNAEKLLNQYLRDAQEDYDQVKRETASVMAEEAAAKRRLDEVNDQVARYEKYAAAAVKAGNDADALKFLEAKGQLAPKVEEAQQIYAHAKQNSEQMRQMTQKLMTDIQEAQSKMSELKAKLRMAESKEKMQDLNEKLAGNNSLGNFGSLADAVQKRIDAADARAELNATLGKNTEMEDLEKKYAAGAGASSAAQDELAALKAKMGLGTAPAAPADPVLSDAQSELAALKAQLGQ